MNDLSALLEKSYGALLGAASPGAAPQDLASPEPTGATMDAVLPPLSDAAGVQFRAVWCSVTDEHLHGGWYLAVRVDQVWHAPTAALLAHLDGSAPAPALLERLHSDGDARAVLVGERLEEMTGVAIDEGPRVGVANCAIRRTWPVRW